jgi:hypothetical protein
MVVKIGLLGLEKDEFNFEALENKVLRKIF